ncbi:hypothetical protein Tco_1227896 [Tanacetum coccineum]
MERGANGNGWDNLGGEFGVEGLDSNKWRPSIQFIGEVGGHPSVMMGLLRNIEGIRPLISLLWDPSRFYSSYDLDDALLLHHPFVEQTISYWRDWDQVVGLEWCCQGYLLLLFPCHVINLGFFGLLGVDCDGVD